MLRPVSALVRARSRSLDWLGLQPLFPPAPAAPALAPPPRRNADRAAYPALLPRFFPL